jgi:hypothetical protein
VDRRYTERGLSFRVAAKPNWEDLGALGSNGQVMSAPCHNKDNQTLRRLLHPPLTQGVNYVMLRLRDAPVWSTIWISLI